MLMNTTFLEDSFLIKWQSRGEAYGLDHILPLSLYAPASVEIHFLHKKPPVFRSVVSNTTYFFVSKSFRNLDYKGNLQ